MKKRIILKKIGDTGSGTALHALGNTNQHWPFYLQL
jgi:hypothetical protein